MWDLCMVLKPGHGQIQETSMGNKEDSNPINQLPNNRLLPDAELERE